MAEVVSPESVGRDRGDKYYEYEEAGVPEYWLIDPQRNQIEFYELGQNGQYKLTVAGAEDVYRSKALPGFWVKIEWLLSDPLPSPLRVVAEIAGADPDLVDRFEQALRGGGPE